MLPSSEGLEGLALTGALWQQQIRRLRPWWIVAAGLLVSGLIIRSFAESPLGVSWSSGPRLCGTLVVNLVLVLWCILGAAVPRGLSIATTHEMLPLVQLTNLSPRRMWSVCVVSHAWPAVVAIAVHLPVFVWLETLGGLTAWDRVSTAVALVSAFVLGLGWASLAGCLWNGDAKATAPGILLTALVGFVYCAVFAAAWNVAHLNRWPVTDVFAASVTGPWGPPGWWRCAPLLHVLGGGGCLWISQVLLRGRWRLMIEGSAPLIETRWPKVTLSNDDAAASAATAAVDAVLAKQPPVTAPRQPAEQPREELTSKRRKQPVWQRAPSTLGTRIPEGGRPFFWKDLFVHGGGRNELICRWVLSGLASAALGFYQLRPERIVGELILALTLVLWSLYALYEVSQPMDWEFRDRMWSTVRITPLSVGEILWSKCLALIWRIVPTLLPVMTVLSIAVGQGQSQAAGIGLLIMIATIPLIGSLLWYGSIIPSDIFSLHWGALRTVGVLTGLAALTVTLLMTVNDPQVVPVIWQPWLAGLVMLIGSGTGVVWVGLSTLWELDDPRKEQLASADE